MKYSTLIISVCLLTLSGNGIYASDKKSDKQPPATITEDFLNTQLVTIQNRQISLNDCLLAIGRSGEVKIVLTPELSGPEQLGKILAMTLGERPLVEVLNQLCPQVGAQWTFDDQSKSILIKPADKVIAKTPEGAPLKMVIDFEAPGKPLGIVASELNAVTGAEITIPEKLKNIIVEISVKEWELKRLLDNICFMYDLEYAPNKKGQLIFSKKVQQPEEDGQ